MAGGKMPVSKISLTKDKGRLQLMIMGAVVPAALVLSLLWLLTTFNSWKGVMLERRINLGEQVSGETLARVWEGIQDLDGSFLTGGHVHLPVLAGQLMILEDSIPLEDRGIALLRAEEAALLALSREPANSFSWARLAWFRYIQEGPSAQTLYFLRMSIYTAPAKRSLILWRLQMCARHRQFWDPDFENLIIRQIHFAWKISPQRLAMVVSESGIAGLARQALQGSAQDLERLEIMLSRDR